MSSALYSNTPAAPNQPAKTPTKRSARWQLYMCIVLAVLVAGVALFALTGGSGDKVYVLKSAHGISSLAEIGDDDLVAVQVPKAAVEGGVPTADELAADADRPVAQRTAFAQRAFSASSEAKLKKMRSEYLQAARARSEVPTGVQIRGDMVTFDSALGAALAPDERLVSIQAKVASALGGALRPGDRVDMYAVNSSGTNADLVIRNIEIMATGVDQATYNAAVQRQVAASDNNRDLKASDVLPSSPIPGTYIVKVKASDVARVTLYDSAGHVYLTYRPADAVDSDVPTATAGQAPPPDTSSSSNAPSTSGSSNSGSTSNGSAGSSSLPLNGATSSENN